MIKSTKYVQEKSLTPIQKNNLPTSISVLSLIKNNNYTHVGTY